VSQTSLLGEKFVEIHAPMTEPAQGRLENGDVIALASTDTDATVEEVGTERRGQGHGVRDRLPVGPEGRLIGPEVDAPALEPGEELLEARSLLLAGIRPVPEQRQHLGKKGCDLRR
jgi:hypothetical protein